MLAILHNPAYAGAYVYGRKALDPTRRRPGHPHGGLVNLSLAGWPVCPQGVCPAYVGWERHPSNRQRLADNQNRREADRRGAPRQGQALLQGVVRRGRCGALLHVRCSGPEGQYPVYRCAAARHEYNRPCCQEVRALALDAEIERHLFAALEPDKLALALAALEQFEQEDAALQRQWRLRLEHARHDAERAARQYNAVEPGHRLVARTLERQREDRRRSLEEPEQAYQRRAVRQAAVLTEADRPAILALAGDLPGVWQAPTTTPADRRQLLRLVIQGAIVDAKAEPGRVRYRIVWQTGATGDHVVHRPVGSCAGHPRRGELESRVRAPSASRKTGGEIAAALNAEGFQAARGRRFSGSLVRLLRHQRQVAAVERNGNGPNPPRWSGGTYPVDGLAQAVGVAAGAVHDWIYRGRVEGRQSAKGMPWKTSATPGGTDELKQHVERVRHASRSRMEAV